MWPQSHIHNQPLTFFHKAICSIVDPSVQGKINSGIEFHFRNHSDLLPLSQTDVHSQKSLAKNKIHTIVFLLLIQIQSFTPWLKQINEKQIANTLLSCSLHTQVIIIHFSHKTFCTLVFQKKMPVLKRFTYKCELYYYSLFTHFLCVFVHIHTISKSTSVLIIST